MLIQKSGIILCFANFFNAWLKQYRQILISASTFNMLLHHTSLSFCKTPLYTGERVSEYIRQLEFNIITEIIHV